MYSMALHQAVRSESSIFFICQILAQPAAFRLRLGLLAVEHGCDEASCRGPAGWETSEGQDRAAQCLRAPDHGVDAGRVCTRIQFVDPLFFERYCNNKLLKRQIARLDGVFRW